MYSSLVDFENLQKEIFKRKIYRLSDVKDKIKKVAFDIVRFVDNDKIDELWQIQSDGENEYIVAMYDEAEKKVANNKINWSAIPDKSGNINVFYQGNPIKKIALSKFGIPIEDSWLVSNQISKKLASDNDFLNSFIKELSIEEKRNLNEIDSSLLAGK